MTIYLFNDEFLPYKFRSLFIYLLLFLLIKYKITVKKDREVILRISLRRNPHHPKSMLVLNEIDDYCTLLSSSHAHQSLTMHSTFPHCCRRREHDLKSEEILFNDRENLGFRSWIQSTNLPFLLDITKPIYSNMKHFLSFLDNLCHLLHFCFPFN